MATLDVEKMAEKYALRVMKAQAPNPIEPYPEPLARTTDALIAFARTVALACARVADSYDGSDRMLGDSIRRALRRPRRRGGKA